MSEIIKSEIYSIVCEMLCDAKDLEPETLSEDLPLKILKLDSLDYVELMVLVKREFDISLSADMFIEHPDMTLGEMCQMLEALR